MNKGVQRFPQFLYDRVAQPIVPSPVTRENYIDDEWCDAWGRRMGEGGSSNDRRKLSRREWRRAAAAMSVNMEGAGIDPNPEVWQLFADKTLLAALGPMVGSVLIVDRDGFALAMSRMFARKRI